MTHSVDSTRRPSKHAMAGSFGSWGRTLEKLATFRTSENALTKLGTGVCGSSRAHKGAVSTLSAAKALRCHFFCSSQVV
eukprot:CAMPEP_0195145514 /NCGR_PEP_ID=MMETSP0448-20130528/169962_1 /TAXON_ID=66468 /ORGANISM="Heterocapsa triquestra, Strain CCMP 448" /LENGTH=78 /DNA_ID=CAMNT_0040184029 /DNA_START=16 /DNA_END=248 /DNA_ORIENTATION=+